MSEENHQPSSNLTTAQKCRIERNREKALNLRQARLVSHPYNGTDGASSSIIKVQGTKYVDSGGGFLLEQPVAGASQKAVVGSDADKDKAKSSADAVVANEAIAIPITYEECLDCGDNFAESFLFSNFGYSVCDKCRSPDERHALITRTEAKAEYLLKDCDLDKREPPLRYISRKNPHNIRWGEMKLYLLLHIEERAMQVWGSEEELERQHELREEKREVTKVRKYNKQMKQLRMEVRSSLYTKETKSSHTHEYGEETYNEVDDNYSHVCTICGFNETFEKM